MNETPSVVVLLRGATPVGVFRTDDTADATRLGDTILAGPTGHGTSIGWTIERVPAPNLVGRTAPAPPSPTIVAAAQAERETMRVCAAQLRSALRGGTADGVLEALPWRALLNLVRSVVEAANSPAEHRADLEAKAQRLAALVGDDPARVQLDAEALDRAARAAYDGDTPWESLDGRIQQNYVEDAQRAVTAYLDEDEG